MRKRLDEVAALVGGTLHGDPSVEIEGVAGLNDAGPEDITFLADRKHIKDLARSQAAAVLATSAEDIDRPVIEVANPYAAFADLLEAFHPSAPPPGTVDERAAVDPSASLGEGVTLFPYAVVGAGVVVGDRAVIHSHAVVGDGCAIGADCVLHPNVTLYPGVTLGQRVIVHGGTVLGSDGFGYAELEDGTRRKIPQVGRVVVEDDVEIGANVTVDRATLGTTVIRRGTKIDNLVHIGHNSVVGADGIIAAQAGLSGSCEVGDRVVILGQVGLMDHVRVGDGATLIAQAGITSDVEAGEVVSLTPSMPHAVTRRVVAALPKLPDLLKGVRALAKRLEALEKSQGEAGDE
ncbi:MAG: UDP-3-O-(3-hydroxymyristoyl)glucosamine N-acyltransferase [bacterium]|nr:UDP-3-O-(3-hydroxymyristoyl)glucosamine N-acyltransferase [bacterium]